MVSDTSGNKRSYSHMEPNRDESEGVAFDATSKLENMTATQRRDYIGEHKVPSDPDEYMLVSSKWYQEFMEGHDAPVVLAKGAAGEQLDMNLYDQLVDLYGINDRKLAFRFTSLDNPDSQFVIIELNPINFINSELNIKNGHLLWAAKSDSQFATESDISVFGRTTIPIDLQVVQIALFENESLILVPPSSMTLGHVGLNNMGNTCFMNSSLQALLHIPELIRYFGSGEFTKDLNPMNPIGCYGQVAEAFASLIRQMYSQKRKKTAIRPAEFLRTIGKFNRAFASRMQQDSQEFTSFLLDSLHEDLNRIRDKPATEKPELPDDEPVTEAAVNDLAIRSWKTHKKRNDSKIMDLFTGMYKSTLVCPVCDKVSITFDPFFDLTLPLPSSSVWMKKVIYVPNIYSEPNLSSSSSEPAIYSIEVALQPNNTILQMKQQIAGLVNAESENSLVVCDVYGSKFYRMHKDTDTLIDAIDPSDEIFVYELSNAGGVDVPVYFRYENSGTGIPFFVNVDESLSVDAIKTQLVSGLKKFSRAANTHVEADALSDGNPDTNSNGPDWQSGMVINIYDGTVDELVYGYGGGRLHQFWSSSSTEQHSSTEEQAEEETFVSLEPEKPENEGIENLPTPASSPNPGPYSPSATSSSSSSISPLSSTASLPEIMRSSEAPPDRNEQQNPENNTKYDPHKMVLVVDINFAGSLPDLDSVPSIENESAHRARNALEDHKNTSLDDCLRNFSQPEVLSDQDLWHCPRCKDFRQAQKRLELWQVPEILMVHLKRFSGLHNMSRKINDLVVFPRKGLDLAEFVSDAAVHSADADPNLSQDDFVYDLIAVDNHFGGMGGGHYTSFVMDPFTGEWLDFNDSYVSTVTEDDVCTDAAYLLFYMKRSKEAKEVEQARQVAYDLRSGPDYETPIASPSPFPSPSISRLPSRFQSRCPSPIPEEVNEEEGNTEEPENTSTGTSKNDNVFIGEGRKLGTTATYDTNISSPSLPWATKNN